MSRRRKTGERITAGIGRSAVKEPQVWTPQSPVAWGGLFPKPRGDLGALGKLT